MTDPLATFLSWYAQAVALGCERPDAMALATSDSRCAPSVRVVLFRGVSHGGIRFFTNYESRKGQELRDNPLCAAVFYWPRLQKQVRFEGRAEKLSESESDEYFDARPRGHRLAALASRQSHRLVNRADLVERWHALEHAYEASPIPRPAHWGGYRIIPSAVEFWTEGEHRLHERTRLERHGDSWIATELEP